MSFLISAPLNAAIEVQRASGLSIAAFVEQVGFLPKGKKMSLFSKPDNMYDVRQDIARLIHNDLAKNNRPSFANPKLADEVAEMVKCQFPDLASASTRKYLADLQHDYLSQPAKDVSVALLYRAKDFDQIKSELIHHLDLEFKLE